MAGMATLAALIIAGFAFAQREMVADAATNPGNLSLGPQMYLAGGCPLGPAFTFCDQAPGTQGQWATFVVNATAAVTGVTETIAAIPGLAGNFAAGDFTVTTTPPPGATSVPCTGNLGANQSCAFFVAFSPTAAGLRQAQISVTDSAGDSLLINVEGTGTQLALAPPVLAPSGCTTPPTVDNAYTFCSTPVGSASASETFTLSSSSGASGVNVALAAIPGLESEFAAGDFTMEGTTCTGALAPNASCTTQIAFTPTAPGIRAAALTATDSSGDTTTLYLAGPAGANLAFSAAGAGDAEACGQTNPFLFCNLPVGGISQAVTFRLMNTSGTQLTGLTVPTGSVFAQGATAPDFTVQNSSCTSVLAAGASCNLNVAFTPTATGLRQGAIVVTDAQGDSSAVNLAGVGDDYSIATQLPTEISVIPGKTATFNATLTPDNVFGMNGEQVTFVCPTNLPGNTSCAVTPCPAAITPGTPVSVTVTIVTSSATVIAPQPSGGCSSYTPSQSGVVRTPANEGPAPPNAANRSTRGSPFPALLVLFGFAAIGMLAASFAFAGRAGSRKRVPLMIACAGLVAVILTGCHHHAPLVTTATPTGTTVLTVHGNATDANGNSLNTSRQFQVTLDVVTK
jgi:hypothetical protein